MDNIPDKEEVKILPNVPFRAARKKRGAGVPVPLDLPADCVTCVEDVCASHALCRVRAPEASYIPTDGRASIG